MLGQGFYGRIAKGLVKDRRLARFGRASVGIAVICTLAASASADQYTVLEIADAMAAARAQVTDLRTRFLYEFATVDPSFAMTSIDRIEGVYSMRLPGPREMFQYKWFTSVSKKRIDPPPSAVRTSRPIKPATTRADNFALKSQQMISFDGDATLVLDEMRRDHAPLRATIYAGREDRAFSPYLFSPDTLVWCWLRTMSYESLLRRPDAKFTIAGQREALGGVNCIKLTGSAFAGRIKMTLWIAPSRGFLPLRSDVRDTKRRGSELRIELRDLLQLRPGIWYPRLILISNPNYPAAANPSFMVLRGLSIAAVPNSIFHPTLPEGTIVTDTIGGMAFTVNNSATTKQATTESVEQQLDGFIKAATSP